MKVSGKCIRRGGCASLSRASQELLGQQGRHQRVGCETKIAVCMGVSTQNPQQEVVWAVDKEQGAWRPREQMCRAELVSKEQKQVGAERPPSPSSSRTYPSGVWSSPLALS